MYYLVSQHGLHLSNISSFPGLDIPHCHFSIEKQFVPKRTWRPSHFPKREKELAMIRKTKFLVSRPGKDSLNSLNSALSGDKWAIFGLLPLCEVGQCPAGPQLTLCQSRFLNVRSYSNYWLVDIAKVKSLLTVTDNVNHLEYGGRTGVRWLERGFDSWCLF